MGTNESKKRTLSKAVLYRIILIFTDAVVVYSLTRRVDITIASIGLISVTNTIVYYFYDRAWSKIK